MLHVYDCTRSQVGTRVSWSLIFDMQVMTPSFQWTPVNSGSAADLAELGPFITPLSASCICSIGHRVQKTLKTRVTGHAGLLKAVSVLKSWGPRIPVFGHSKYLIDFFRPRGRAN